MQGIILPQVETMQRDQHYSPVTEETYQDMPLTSQEDKDFTKSLNAQGWNGIGNIATFTCFIVMKYNKPNSAATGREVCISFDPPRFGKAFYAVDNRDNSTEPTTTYGPSLFVGTSNGYVRRFRNNEHRYNLLVILGT